MWGLKESDSPGYLPEVLTVVADTAGTACPPGMQPGQPHQPRVQLIAHSGAETASVGSQHLCAPTASEPAGWESREPGPAPPPTAYNPAIARAQVHQLSRAASQQRQHVLHLPHTRPDIGHLGKETWLGGLASISHSGSSHAWSPNRNHTGGGRSLPPGLLSSHELPCPS